MKTLYAAIAERDLECGMGEVYHTDTMEEVLEDAKDILLNFDDDAVLIYQMIPVRILRRSVTEESLPYEAARTEPATMYGAGVGVEGR